MIRFEWWRNFAWLEKFRPGRHTDSIAGTTCEILTFTKILYLNFPFTFILFNGEIQQSNLKIR